MSHFSIQPPEPDPDDMGDLHLDQFRRLIENDSAVPSPDVERLVDTLAANGGGELSSDLALDILLNAIVEQARLATGSSGAAIALVKDGEMVCRATAGPTAPDLGIRLDTSSGLSGACVATGQVQLCGDTQVDPRVDALASRQLGVRSILVFPLLEGGEILGVFEIFSPRPQAFGERDIHTLEALARRILIDRHRAVSRSAVIDDGVLREAEDGIGYKVVESKAISDSTSQPSHSASTELTVELTPSRVVPARPYGSIDVTTAILASIVIAAGIGLGLLIGWRSGAITSIAGMAKTPTVAGGANAKQVKTPNASTLAQQPASPEPVRIPKVASRDESGVTSRPSKPVTGGLVVFENGKEVFRMLPADADHRLGPVAEGVARSNAMVTLTPDEANARLIHRVEPESPVAMSPGSPEQRIELEVIVGIDGVVETATALSGDPTLSDAALAAVRQWHYQPLVVGGRNTPFRTRLSLAFSPSAK